MGIATEKPQEITEIFDKFYSGVFTIIFGGVENSDIAADIAQEVFLDLLGVENLPGPSEIRAYLSRSASNKIRDYYRHMQQEQDLLDIYEMHLLGELRPDTHLTLIDFLHDAISKSPLSENGGEAVKLFLDNHEVPAIAKKMGVSEKQAKSYIAQAIPYIRRQLKNLTH